MLSKLQISENKNLTLNLLSLVSRPGITDLTEYLETSSFFDSPASTKYHNNFPGGLCLHSLIVTRMFSKRNEKLENSLPLDSVILCGILHDLCKVGYYHQEGEVWKSDKTHPANQLHGCLSVQIAEQYIKLTPEEEAVIKFHMGLFSVYGYVKEYSAEELHEAISMYPSVQIFAACDNEEAHMKTKVRYNHES